MYRPIRSIGLSDETVAREFGVIHTYDPFKGFGFIRRTKGKDVFFFYDQLPKGGTELSEGDLVSFGVEKKPKGPGAINIQKVGHIAS